MHRPFVLAALALAAPVVLGAQQAAAPAGTTSPLQAPLFRSESELVVVHATVRDGRGAHVNGLPPQAFSILENGRPQSISVFGRPDEPVTIGLIVDVSGSMDSQRHRLAYAASSFAGTGNPDDEIFAIVVADTPLAVLPSGSPFTSDPAVLRAAIAQAHRPGGLTALYDAIGYGLEYLERGTHARRALVVISDGIDNASRVGFEETLRRTQASNAAIYALGLVDPISLARDPGHLRRLARATGGEAYFPPTNIAAVDVLGSIAREIRSAYALGFVPSGSLHDGRHHRLEVAVRAPDGRSLKVRAREGYLAGSDRSGAPPAR